ncbi:MAG: mechanosensitive ion channel family protein [Holosporales bacterium]|jgi:small conductance mechanosensitive channel|nr:mechanosensitive ion channel family protein [Holosporales bacterium]
MKEDVIESGNATKSFLDQANINNVAIAEIILIVILCICARIFIKKTKNHFIAKTRKAQKEQKVNASTAQLLLTTITVCESIAKILVLIIGALSCLAAVNISVSPVVYGLGFISLGVSLGAQDTFTDIFRGLLTLIEGKVSPGDCLSINGRVGYVETLTIRQIVLRHFDGSLESFPYSKISTIQNFSLGYHVMACSYCIASDSDVEEFEEFTREVLESMRRDRVWGEFLTEDTQPHPSLEFESVWNTCIKITVRVRTKIDPEDDFASEFNLRMLRKLQNTKMLRVVK